MQSFRIFIDSRLVNAAIKIQSWYRMCVVRSIFYVAKKRFEIIADTITYEIKSIFPSYEYKNGLDYLSL